MWALPSQINPVCRVDYYYNVTTNYVKRLNMGKCLRGRLYHCISIFYRSIVLSKACTILFGKQSSTEIDSMWQNNTLFIWSYDIPCSLTPMLRCEPPCNFVHNVPPLLFLRDEDHFVYKIGLTALTLDIPNSTRNLP